MELRTTVLRIRLLSVGFVIAVIIVCIRLFVWQVVRGEDLASQGRYQQQNSKKLLAQRGDILASDGSWLAASTDAWLLFAEVQNIELTPREISEKLAPIFVDARKFEESGEEEEDKKSIDEQKKEALESEEDRLVDLLSKDKLVWVPLKNRINRAMREKIEALEIVGLGFQTEEDRTYPEASAAAQLLGFVGKDDEGNDKGYFGLEGYYDLPLTGKDGFKNREANAIGAPLIFGSSKESAAVRGANLITSIDKTVQLVVEKNLQKGLEKYGALSGTIIVSRPKDGAIIAMASWPSYDPKNYFDYGDSYFKNPAISDSFEPGSIFKPIVMAAGLDAGVITPETICDVCDRPYQVDKYFIKTWNNEYNANSSMTDVIVHSDNVGMAFIGDRLGAERMYDYLNNFGFGRITDIDLQGEFSPEIRERGTWNIVDLATSSFGQGIAVTPMQMVKAIGIIANDGREVNPQVVDKVQIGDSIEDIPAELGKQVISPEAARDITNMMIAAVKNGEAKWAVPQGFSIAGKTGTAQIPVAGHYDDEKTIASFVGFAPPRDPEFLMLVTLREPKSSPWASETAAPLWFDIAKEVFPYLGIKPGN